MKNKMVYIIIGFGILLGLTGFVVYRSIAPSSKPKPIATEETPIESVEPLDTSVAVSLTKSKSKDNTVILRIDGLGSNYTFVSYELSYDSQGIVQGVTSKPLDVREKDSFVRDDIYLGTCSRNVCRPHAGVKKTSVVLEFTLISGKKSQFSKDYDL